MGQEDDRSDFSPFCQLISLPFLPPWFTPSAFLLFISRPPCPLLFHRQTRVREQEVALLFHEGVRFLCDTTVFRVWQSPPCRQRKHYETWSRTFKCSKQDRCVWYVPEAKQHLEHQIHYLGKYWYCFRLLFNEWLQNKGFITFKRHLKDRNFHSTPLPR